MRRKDARQHTSNRTSYMLEWGSLTDPLVVSSQAAVFIAIFSLSSLVYLYQIFRPKPKRMLWMLVFPICGLSKLERGESKGSRTPKLTFGLSS